MTVNHNDELDDAEFEAFMEGKGDLADLLQALPQAMPSPALDAAILANVEASLSIAQPTMNAANDPAAFAPPKHRPSFLSRWKLPLGLAASALLTISLLSPQWQKQTEQKPAGTTELAQINSSPSPATLAAASPAGSIRQQTNTSAIDKDANYPKMAQADMGMSPRIAQLDEVARKKTSAASAKAENATEALKKTKIIAEKETDNVSVQVIASPAITSLPPLAAAKPVPTESPAAGETQNKQTMQYELAEASPPQSLQMNKVIVTRAAPARSFAQARMADSKNISDAAPLSESRVPDSREMDESKQMPLALNAPAPVASVAPAMNSNASISSSRQVSEQTVAPTANHELPPKADIWLRQIEKLIKADSRKEALSEWNKFRIAYPDYLVKKSTLRQIESINKDAMLKE